MRVVITGRPAATIGSVLLPRMPFSQPVPWYSMKLKGVFGDEEPSGIVPTFPQVTTWLGFPRDTVLRRYMVDEEFMERDPTGGLYWRAGGTVDV